MYAQCPECLTFFHLRPAHLRAAGGRVRCSRCKHVFNALDTLREELSEAELAEMKAARRRESKSGAASEDAVGDLFDGLDYTANEELKLDEPDPVDGDDRAERDAKEAALLAAAPGPVAGVDPVFAAPAREFDAFAPPRARRRRPLLTGLINLLLLVLFAAQIVHWQRERVLAHPVAGPYLRTAYTWLGIDTAPPRNLAALKVARTEVSSHPDHPRALHLTALLENSAERAQPWPELRVDLQDRWGETVGARYFKPREYLREPQAAAQPLEARGRAAISLAILDPGSDAVGFQIEPCYPTGEGDEPRHVCVSDLNDAR